MKIALLSEKYTPDLGGLAISVGRLGQLLAAVGHDVRVFSPTLSLPPSERRTLTHGGVCVTRFGAHKRVDDTLVDWFELIVEEHRREPFDLLQGYFLPQAGFVTVYAGKYLNLPSVVSIRGNDIERAAFDPSRFSHVMYALQNADVVTTNASELASKAKAFVKREIVLIANSVDTERFKPMEANEALAEALEVGKMKEERAVIGFAGELREKKGLRSLLDAYAQINKTRSAALLIVGEIRAGEDSQVFDEFRSTNPDSHIIVTGYVAHEDLPAYYALMDVFVHPSLRDGMPNAVLEAMACGVPVVSTPVGGILDFICDGENGLTVPVNDADAICHAIQILVADTSLRERLTASALQSIRENFTIQKELEANLRVYQQLQREE